MSLIFSSKHQNFSLSSYRVEYIPYQKLGSSGNSTKNLYLMIQGDFNRYIPYIFYLTLVFADMFLFPLETFWSSKLYLQTVVRSGNLIIVARLFYCFIFIQFQVYSNEFRVEKIQIEECDFGGVA